MDAIVILGAAVWPSGPSPTLRRRTEHAARLWHAGVAPRIIACGGLGEHPPTEAAAMQAILRDAGVNPAAILSEDRSRSTLENIKNAKTLLAGSGSSVTIVTDAYHGPRARMTARHFGLRATLSCPKAPRLQIRLILREIAAFPVYAIKLHLQRVGH